MGIYATVTLTLFMFTVHSVRNKAAYFAERLYKSMKVYSVSQCRIFESNLPTVRPLQKCFAAVADPFTNDHALLLATSTACRQKFMCSATRYTVHDFIISAAW